MSDNATLTLRVPADLKERLGVLAEKTKRTRSVLAGEALADYVDRELRHVEAIQRGLDDMRAGRVVPHEDAMRQVRDTILKAGEGS